jgi:signal transduction histidine kinase
MLDRSLPSVLGDAELLRRAFINILVNACEAMPDGGTLTVTSEREALQGAYGPRPAAGRRQEITLREIAANHARPLRVSDQSRGQGSARGS